MPPLKLKSWVWALSDNSRHCWNRNFVQGMFFNFYLILQNYVYLKLNRKWIYKNVSVNSFQIVPISTLISEISPSVLRELLTRLILNSAVFLFFHLSHSVQIVPFFALICFTDNAALASYALAIPHLICHARARKKKWVLISRRKWISNNTFFLFFHLVLRCLSWDNRVSISYYSVYLEIAGFNTRLWGCAVHHHFIYKKTSSVV